MPLRFVACTADTAVVTELPRWCVGCRDPFGRDRAVMVLVEEGSVVLVPPPGASAVLSAEQTRSLGAVLSEAAVAVDRRGPGWGGSG